MSGSNPVTRRALARLTALFLTVTSMGPGQSALAQRDVRLQQAETAVTCKNITPKKQLVLERRALGGDPRAQFVLAFCAWPKVGQPKGDEQESYQSEERIFYAYKWATIAYCDQEYNDLDEETAELEDENRIFERLKPARDLRRIAANQREDERRVLLEIRKEVNDALYRLEKTDRPSKASKEFVKQMKGLGASGLASLALMRDCPTYPEFEQKHVRGGVWQNVAKLMGFEFDGGVLKTDQKELKEFRISDQEDYDSITKNKAAYQERAYAEYKASVGKPQMSNDDVPRDVRQRISEDWKRYFASRAVGADDWAWPKEEVKLWTESLAKAGAEEDLTRKEEFLSAYSLRGGSNPERSGSNRFENMGKVPVQYLQLALGAFREVKGRSGEIVFPGIALEAFSIDNVYGEQTAKLVKKAQTNFCVIRDVALSEDALRNVTQRAAQDQGEQQLHDESLAFGIERFDECDPDKPGDGRTKAEEARKPGDDYPTGWLSPLQARTLICRAAVDRNDPYSYLHLAQMFSKGYGYSVDFDRALYAVKRARLIFSLEPKERVSNHGDLRNSPLEKLYIEQAEQLERNITKSAAEAFLGTGDITKKSTLERLNDRLAVARYDDDGALCDDEKWLGDKGKGKTKPQKKAALDAQSSGVDRDLGDRAAALPGSAPLPVTASVDRPFMLNAATPAQQP